MPSVCRPVPPGAARCRPVPPGAARCSRFRSKHVSTPQHQQRLIQHVSPCQHLPCYRYPLLLGGTFQVPRPPMPLQSRPARPSYSTPWPHAHRFHIDDIDSRYRSALDFLSRSLAHPPAHSLTQHPRAQVRAVALIASPLRVIARGGREAHRHAPPIVQAEPIAVEHRVGRDVVVHDEAWVPRRPEEGAWRRGR